MDVKMLCYDCECVGYANAEKQGSNTTEIILWCLFLIPGFAYRLWRKHTKLKTCQSCGSDNVMPLFAPNAQAFLIEHAS